MHAASVVVVVLAAGLAAGGGDERDVGLRAVPADERATVAPTVEELEDGDVLTIRVDEGVPGARGRVQQCERTVGGFRQCRNSFPVLFDDEGRATFQYRLDDPGRCGATGSCVVVVRDDDEERVAYAFTVFHEPAPPRPTVTLTPPGPYATGDEVRVEVSALAPGTGIETAFCERTCRAMTQAVAGEDGTATATVVIGPRCDRCGIAVVGAARSSLVTVEFARPAAAAYNTPRLIAGLAAAAVFLLLAWRIVATVDWRPPSEAATPELDRSELG